MRRSGGISIGIFDTETRGFTEFSQYYMFVKYCVPYIHQTNGVKDVIKIQGLCQVSVSQVSVGTRFVPGVGLTSISWYKVCARCRSHKYQLVQGLCQVSVSQVSVGTRFVPGVGLTSISW